MKKSFSLACLVILSWVFAPRPSSAQSNASVEGLLDRINRLPGTERQQKLREGARKEGELVWYSTMNRENSQELINLFEQEHPFIRVKLLNGSAVQTMTPASIPNTAQKTISSISLTFADFFCSRSEKSKLLRLTARRIVMHFGRVTKMTRGTSMPSSHRDSCSFSIRTWSNLKINPSRWKIC